MALDDIGALDSDLPLVRRAFPWPVRVGCVAAGAFAIVMPLWELGRGLWPPSIATPVFARIATRAMDQLGVAPDLPLPQTAGTRNEH